MSDSSSGRRSVAGYNQFLKLVRRGRAKKVLLACDCDPRFRSAVLAELATHPEIILDQSETASKLASIAGVDVPTAVITLAD